MKAFSSSAAGVVLALVASAAAAAELEPGSWITERGWGQLTLRAGADGGFEFELQSMGSNGHSCALEGHVEDDRATVPTDEGQACRISFDASAQGIAVAVHADDQEQCRWFCGARAGFEGDYLAVPQGCLPAEVAATRERFKKLYDQRQYAPAAALLDALTPRCGRLLEDIELGWIASDLAITRLKLGDRTGCRAALEERVSLAEMSDEGIAENYPPLEAELYTRLAKAVRTNLKLCAEPAQAAAR